MKNTYTVRAALALAALGLAAAGCGQPEDGEQVVVIDDENNTTGGEADAGAGENSEDDGGIPTVGDAGTEEDTGDDGCDEIAELALAWPLNDAVADGSFSATEADGVWTATVDASAGGFQGAARNPFLYIDLDTGAKVEVTDLEAGRTDVTWDIAVRRTSTFINGGDSGPGAVEITRLTGTTFEDVTAADVGPGTVFVTEDGVDANCQVIPSPTGFGSVLSVFEQINTNTSSGSWFDYGVGGAGVSTYPDHVYILRGTDGGKTYKFSFDAWESGVYTIRWAEI
jgi:hypothetical protein